MNEEHLQVNLSGKTAIVTGGSRGIGKAIAFAMAGAGANVVVASRTEDDSATLPGTIYKTVEEIRNLGGVTTPVRCDVTKADEVKRMVETTLNTYGKIDILVNNAGVINNANFMDTDITAFTNIWQVNVLGPFLCTQAVLPGMMARKSGNIVSIASGLAESTHPTYNIYSASKAALSRMMVKLAAEVADYNIAVNVLSPGGIRSEGMIAISTDELLSRLPPPTIIGPPILWLAAQDAKSFTGKVVQVNKFGIEWP